MAGIERLSEGNLDVKALTSEVVRQVRATFGVFTADGLEQALTQLDQRSESDLDGIDESLYNLRLVLEEILRGIQEFRKGLERSTHRTSPYAGVVEIEPEVLEALIGEIRTTRYKLAQVAAA